MPVRPPSDGNTTTLHQEQLHHRDLDLCATATILAWELQNAHQGQGHRRLGTHPRRARIWNTSPSANTVTSVLHTLSRVGDNKECVPSVCRRTTEVWMWGAGSSGGTVPAGLTSSPSGQSHVKRPARVRAERIQIVFVVPSGCRINAFGRSQPARVRSYSQSNEKVYEAFEYTFAEVHTEEYASVFLSRRAA